MWSQLGHEPSVALAQFRSVDSSLLVENSVVAIAQVDGKLRDRFEVASDISEADLRELALSSDAVKKAIGDRELAQVIVRAPKLVNIATKG
jgi:leucyl-tRNA synthetase